MTKKILILTFFIISTFYSCGQKIPDKNIIIHVIEFDYIEGCETGKGDCKPIEIVRQNHNDSILLVFPSGGTQTDVYLRSTIKKIELHDQRLSGTEHEGPPSLNLTNLEDGDYSASIMGCNLGGSCIVRLKTKEK